MYSVRATILVLLLVSRPLAGGVVERRGTEPAVEGSITLIDDAGVTVRSELGAVHFVPWDRVRRVVSNTDEPALERWTAVAMDLWRARSRVERHDTTLAEPLLERLFERYRGRTHETALVVAEGLLRCRLARADHALAVIPALEVARLQRAGVTTNSYSTLGPLLDLPTSLCTVLAPVFLPTPLLGSLEHGLVNYDAKGDEVVAAFAQLYRQAVLQALGQSSAEPLAQALPDHPGVQLLRWVVDCGADDVGKSRTARERLARSIPTMAPWAEAWGRFHLGLSLLGESGLGRRQRGMVSLIHLPARFGRSQPYLAGLALAQVAQAMQLSGDAEAARDLRTELRRSFPNHPVHVTGIERISPPQHEIRSPQREEHE